MKRYISLFVAFIIICFAAFTALAVKPGEKVGVKFDSLVFDFGTIHEDSAPVVHEFVCTNIGDSPLAILSAKASCGCTLPEYDRRPIEPGQKRIIKVSFNPRGQGSEVSKDVRIRFKNGKGKSAQVTLRIVGNILPDKK